MRKIQAKSTDPLTSTTSSEVSTKPPIDAAGSNVTGGQSGDDGVAAGHVEARSDAPATEDVDVRAGVRAGDPVPVARRLLRG